MLYLALYKTLLSGSMIKKIYTSFLVLFLCFVAAALFFMVVRYVPIKKHIMRSDRNERKIILVFTSSGGRGHVSATEALQEYLGELYDVRPVYVIRDVLGDLDFIANITGGSYHSEELYNYFLIRKQVEFVRPMVWAGKMFFSMNQRAIAQLLEEYIQDINPALIISVIPMVNGITARVAEQENIPFWVIPTDFDASLFMYQVHRPQNNQFFVNCFYDNDIVKKTLKPAALKPSQYTYMGMPIREQFLRTYNKDDIRKKYQVPDGKPIVMLMMGGRGMRDTVCLSKELMQINTPVHLLLCIGNQPDLIEPLNALPCSPEVTYSIIEFTPHIAELMAISDLFVTKSGGQSVSEALYMGLPMLIDATTPAMDWELLNRTFVEKKDCGALVKRIRKLVPMVQELLNNPAQLMEWRRNIAAIALPNPKQAITAQVIQLIAQ
jgi:processive 1,2-diacylglycerol beta-glucosyltransferase